MLVLLCALVTPLPSGTNLGLLHLLWMLVSGRLLETRGAARPSPPASGIVVPTRRRVACAGLSRTILFPKTSCSPHACASKRPSRPICPRGFGGNAAALPLRQRAPHR